MSDSTTADFVAEHGITATVRPAATNPNTSDWGRGAHHWLVTLHYGDRSMQVPFTQGSAWTTEPTAADVLDCLAADAAGYENSSGFYDWCSEYGYEPDKHELDPDDDPDDPDDLTHPRSIWNAVRRQTSALTDLLGVRLSNQLIYETERD